jgi:YcxB-like protein
MNLIYRVTADDLRASTLAHEKQTFVICWASRLLTAVAVCSLVAFVYLWISNKLHDDSAIANSAKPMALISLMYLPSSMLLPTYLARKGFRESLDAQHPIEVIADESGIGFRSITGEAFVTWVGFIKWKETDSLFNIYSARYAYHPIPKREMTPEQIEQFRALLKSHIVMR